MLDSVNANGSVSFSAVSTLGMIGNEAYSTSLTYPATVNQVIAEFSEAVSLMGLSGTGSITKPITGTKRDVLGTIAGLLGGFVTESNTGSIVIAKYGSGGSASIAPFRSLSLPEFRKTSFNVTGIHITVTEAYEDEEGQEIPEVYFETGTPVIFQTNPWMTQALFNSMASNFVGMSFDLATVDISLGDPRLEAWDKIVVTDLSGSTHTVHCFEIVHTFDGGFSTEVIAEVDSSESSSTNVKGAIQKFVERLDTDVMAAYNAAAQANNMLVQMEDAAEAAGTTLEGIYADAEQAHGLLEEMQDAAGEAGTTLTQIYQDAADARLSSDIASDYANSALNQLGIVQDVVGVLDLLSKNGTYELTQDTEVVGGKWYFTRSGTSPNYVYAVVSTPSGNPNAQGWYELTGIKEAVQNYLVSRLAVTSEGLWIQDPNMETKILLSPDQGIVLHGTDGEEVGRYGETAQIGKSSGFHIEIDGTELGFYQGPNTPDKRNRVAYISNRQLYITQSVVLQQMDLGTPVNQGGLGQWSWKVHPNGENPSRNNLNLKWMG